MRKIVFIVGQGGSGKTTLVSYFQKHLVKNWLFFDFDNGVKVKPHTKNLKLLGEWVDKQRNYWLKEVRSLKYGNKNICLFGVGLFPWKVGDLKKDAYFGYLSLDQDTRKQRLDERGDPHLWAAYQKDISDIVKKLDQAGAKRIDNTNRPIKETAQEIKNWLESL